jgi:hypothetical protein
MRMQDTLKDLNEEFSHFTGTEHYYPHFTRLCVFTDGVKSMADRYSAYWLIDVIASYQIKPAIKSQPFQIWTISSENGKAVVEMRPDADRPVMASQQIPHTDFPGGILKMYYIDDGHHKVLLLPGEY